MQHSETYHLAMKDINDAEGALFRLKNDVRNLESTPKPLSSEQWELLEKCENALYYGQWGANAYTDVTPNEGDLVLRVIWDHAMTACDQGDVSVEEFERETASRVAAALAVLSFGKEFLLK